MSDVWLLMGANAGSRFVQLQSALRLLRNGQLDVLRLSPFYETDPWGNTAQPHFLNVAAHARTELSPLRLLQLLKETEQQLGRTSSEKWGPREIDIDLLFYGNCIVNLSELVIPHPELHKRKFALVPLNDLAPDMEHPVFKKSIAQLLKQCDDSCRVRYYCEGDFQSKAIVVTGKVQGVAFRYYTRQAAAEMGVKGWVANRSDGSVYCEAEGSAATLSRFIAFLHSGSPAAVVSEVQLADREPVFFKTFEVRK